MEQGNKSLGQSEVRPLDQSQAEAQELAKGAGFGHTTLQDDGTVVIGGGCAAFKPTVEGPLKITIQPSKCGEAHGKVLLDYLIKTAGKGVLIEIPSIEDQE